MVYKINQSKIIFFKILILFLEFIIVNIRKCQIFPDNSQLLSIVKK